MNDSLVYPFRLRYLGVRVTPRFCLFFHAGDTTPYCGWSPAGLWSRK